MTGNLRSLAWSVAPVLVALACRGEPRARTPLAPTPIVSPTEPVLSLTELDDLLAAADQPAPAIPTDAGPVARYRLAIRDRLARVGFWQMFAPKLLSILDVHTKNKPGHTIRDLLVERRLPYGRRYHYNKRLGDCGGKDLIEARPWWNTATPITVCRDSVRADVTRQRNGAYCEAVMQVSDDGCGCGPHLLLCAPAESYRKEMAAQTADEVVLTLKHIVDTGARYSTLLTTGSTVRSSFGDYWYARSAFFQGEPLELPRLDAHSRADFALRPRRPEHQGSGILSAPYVLYSDVARRVIVQNLWNDLLCVDWKAVGVDPHKLIEVTADTPDLRGAVLPRLAETPGCKGCHTRLEYPAMALQPFLNAYQGGRYVPPGEPTTFRFHVRGDEDYRGSAPADPRSLANLIIEQPEFTSCAVKHVTEFVYQGHPVPASVRDRLLASFRADENLGKLIEDSLIARIFGEGALAP